MKKLNLSVLIALGFIFILKQGFSQGRIFVVGGIQESWILGLLDHSAGYTGGQVGVGMHLAKLNEHLGFIGELNYSMQGANWYNGEIHVGASYLNIPLVLRYMFSPGHEGWFGEFGLQPGFLLTGTYLPYGGETFMPINDEMKSYDFGLPVGIGYETKGNFGIGLRYIQGLSDLWSERAPWSSYNSVLALRLTWTFNKNK
jgi:hypothetical protein